MNIKTVFADIDRLLLDIRPSQHGLRVRLIHRETLLRLILPVVNTLQGFDTLRYLSKSRRKSDR